MMMGGRGRRKGRKNRESGGDEKRERKKERGDDGWVKEGKDLAIGPLYLN